MTKFTPIPKRIDNPLDNAIAAERLFGNAKNVAALSDVKERRQSSPQAAPQRQAQPTQQAEEFPDYRGMGTSDSGTNLKPTESDQTYLDHKAGKTFAIPKGTVANDGDGLKINGQFNRLYGVDAPDKSQGHETTEYQKSRQGLSDFINTGQAFVNPKGADVHGRPMAEVFKINDNGTLMKYDSVGMANNNLGPFHYTEGFHYDSSPISMVTNPKNQRDAKLEQMYPNAKNVTANNVANHIWINQKKKANKQKR